MSRWYILLLGGICLISTSAILVTLAAVPPTVSAFYRNFFAALIWLLVYPYTRPFCPAPLKTDNLETMDAASSRYGFLVRPGRAPLLLGLLGFFFAVDLWAWHRSIIFLGAGPATLLGNLQVLIVSLLAVFFFREKLQRLFWPGCFLALLGIGMLTLTRGIGRVVLPGLMYGLLTAFTYSFFLVILRLLRNFRITPQQVLFWVSALSAIFLVFPLLGEGGVLTPRGTAVGWLVLHAFLSSVVGWWLIITALPYVPVAVASTLLLLQPVLTSIWGHIFLRQTLSMVQIAGIFFALCGIRLATWRLR
jgi:drug/metabolite transporter (DMT)-like permease